MPWEPPEVVDREVAGVSAWAAFVPPGRGKQWPWKKGTSAFFGLLLLTGVAAGTSWWGVKHFEARLDSNTRADLAGAGVNLDTLEFDWDYRDLTVSGALPDGVSEQQLVDVLRSTDGSGVRKITLQLTRARKVIATDRRKGTVDVVATLIDGRMVLRGTVLNNAQRTRIYEAATSTLGVQNVVQEIEVSGLQEEIPGADQRIDSFANSIAGLDQATDADAALSATDFRFNATVGDENQVVDLLERRGGAGDVGLVISGDIIAKKSVPGGVFDVSVTKADDRITLSGVILSEPQRVQLLDSARIAAAGGAVIDETTVAATDDTSNAAERMQLVLAALDTFSEAEEAMAHITGNVFEFDAMVEFEENTSPLLSVRKRAADNGFEVSGVIKSRKISLTKEVTLLQQEIDQLAEEIRENVVFDSSQSVLGFGAKQTLDKVVDAMNRYQRPVVLISGHTDSSGSRIDNELLSLRRASAVGQYLEDSGIDQLRLRATGFGESAPIASNDTEVGKKQNRRVDFSSRASFDN